MLHLPAVLFFTRLLLWGSPKWKSLWKVSCLKIGDENKEKLSMYVERQVQVG
jgi:hypothetical protein